ncbi:MAG: 5-formyltetrahydrofolate cyclo-ligase [Spirochaetaceae bacterium]|jgi:5-formyltetrahydrofolate cyclo-ligase|nr:5-formyltetrahydrofolate cyclo-ligase [Spirochaetaceae bacterium]
MSLNKKDLRDSMRRYLHTVPQETVHAEGLNAAAAAAAQLWWSYYKTVLCFLSLPHEIDTEPLLNTVLGAGKALFVPRIADRQLDFRRIDDIRGPWSNGSYGIREPFASCIRLCPSDFPALVVMPGLAFDRKGNRLGRGKGYYDTFCAKLEDLHREYRAVGFCLSTQIVPYIPTEAHDKAVDGVSAGAFGFLPRESLHAPPALLAKGQAFCL